LEVGREDLREAEGLEDGEDLGVFFLVIPCGRDCRGFGGKWELTKSEGLRR
jgi:hypothetical protein